MCRGFDVSRSWDFSSANTNGNQISVSGSCRFDLTRQKDADFAFAHFDFKDFQIHFCRTVGDFARAHVETRVMPRALNVESFEFSFGQRPEPMGAEFLKGEKLILDLGDGHDLTADLHAQGPALAKLLRGHDWNEDAICTGNGRGKVDCVPRRRHVSLMPANSDAIIVNQPAPEITGNGKKRHADQRKQERQRMNAKIDIGGKADGETDGVKRDHDQVQDHMRGSSAFRRMIAANISVIGKPRQGREQSCDDTERNGVKRSEREIRHVWKNETGDVEQQTQKEKTDREMDEHWMEWMPERFAFEKIFQHVDLIPAEDWRRRPRRSRAIHLSTSARC